MRIIELLNRINPEIYFKNIYECLFGSREYRYKQAFFHKMHSVELLNSKTTGKIKINMMKNKYIEIICKKPLFFKQNFNSFQNMCIFKKKMKYIYKTIAQFIDKNSKYTKYTNTISFNTNTILIH
jgi:hypothetical protein